WQKINLTDGWYPGASAAETSELVALRRERKERIERAAEPADKTLLTQLEQRLAAITNELSRLPAQSVAYVGAVHSASGTFVGTGSKGGKPRPIYVLNRGNVQKPGAEVGPGALQAVAGLPARFALPANHTEGDRRAALAQWLSDPKNPLTWRSIVNRVWQYHF